MDGEAMKKHLLQEKWGNVLYMTCGFTLFSGKEAKERITVKTKDVTCKSCLRTNEYKDWASEQEAKETDIEHRAWAGNL